MRKIKISLIFFKLFVGVEDNFRLSKHKLTINYG